MRIVGVMGVGLLAAASCCCCGSPSELLETIKEKLHGGPVQTETPAPVATPAPVVEEKVEIGIPTGAHTEPAAEGVFMRYTAEDIDVQTARQFHDHWLRTHAWQVQVDNETPSGWTMEALRGPHRLTIDIEPLNVGTNTGVNVVFKLL